MAIIPNLKGELTPEQISAGNTKTAQLNAGIPIDSLMATVSSITLPQSTDTTTNQIYNTNPVYVSPTPTVDKSQEFIDKYISDTTTAIEDRNQVSKDYKSALESPEMKAKENEVNSINAEIADINAKADQEVLRQTGRMTDVGRISGTQKAIQRNTAIQVLPLQARALIAQNNLTQAQDKLSTLFKLQSEDADRAYNTKIKQIDAVYNFATAEQKARLDALKEENAVKRDEAKALQDAKAEASDMLFSSENFDLISQLTGAKNQDEINNILSLAKVKSKTTGGGILSSLPTSVQTKLMSMANDFGSTDIVKKFNATVDGLNLINGIQTNSTNPSDHQTIVYAFAKSLDPESVVREGEYATIKKYAQSLISSYGKEITNALAGTGFLSEKAIENIKKTMNNNYNSRKPAYDNLYKEKARVIDNYAGQPVSGEILIDYTGGVGLPKTISPLNNLSNDELLNKAPTAPKKEEEKLGEIDTRGFFAKLLGK